MKRLMSRQNYCFHALTLFIVLVLLNGCVDPPKKELVEARTAIDSVVSDGAEQYIPEELSGIIAKLDEALVEVQRQNELLFRNYRLARFLLGQVVAEAETLKIKLAQRKRELNSAADTALQDARSAVSQITRRLDTIQRGTRCVPDLEVVRNEVRYLETELERIKKEIAAGEFVKAGKLAVAVTDRALIMSDIIQRAKIDLAMDRHYGH